MFDKDDSETIRKVESELFGGVTKPRKPGVDVETTLEAAKALREAADALTQASTEINDLREAIKAALRIRDLWGAPNEEINDEHHEEYVALAAMESRFRRVLGE